MKNLPTMSKFFNGCGETSQISGSCRVLVGRGLETTRACFATARLHAVVVMAAVVAMLVMMACSSDEPVEGEDVVSTDAQVDTDEDRQEADRQVDEESEDVVEDLIGPEPETRETEDDGSETEVVETSEPELDAVEEVEWIQCGRPPTGLVSIHGQQFDDLVGILWDEYWSEDGNWRGDMMGDATAFAPELFFPMAHETGCQELHELSVSTVEYELTLVSGFINGGANAMETVVGAPSLITGYQWTQNRQYRFMSHAGLLALASQILNDPEAFSFFFEPVVALGSTAYYILVHVDVSGDEALVLKALEALELADQTYWDEENGVYSELWDWSQALMIMALSRAYRQTGDTGYLGRAERLATTVLEQMWDETRGGFWASHKDEQRGKGLSGQAFMARAFIELYLATCEQIYLDVAGDTIEFSFGPDLYVDGLMRHDWTPDQGASASVCIGCNFFVLSNLWIYDHLISEPCEP